MLPPAYIVNTYRYISYLYRQQKIIATGYIAIQAIAHQSIHSPAYSTAQITRHVIACPIPGNHRPAAHHTINTCPMQAPQPTLGHTQANPIPSDPHNPQPAISKPTSQQSSPDHPQSIPTVNISTKSYPQPDHRKVAQIVQMLFTPNPSEISECSQVRYF